MKFENAGRKEITIFVGHDHSNQPMHTITLHPGESEIRHMDGTVMTITIRGGLLYSGEDKEFTTGQLGVMRENLEQALLKVRSKDARKQIEDVIDILGY